MKKYAFIAITSLLFISRYFLFISTQDVGIEHDSGWYLGVVRNVVEKGIYASYTNSIAVSDKSGSYPSIFGRFSTQDKNGFIYFPAGVTVGPGYIIPQALFLKFFGYGWIQYRIWPFIAFCLLIPLIFLVVFQLGSFFGLLFFQIWLWFYPQLLLNQSYEALSEHIALLYLLLGYVLFQKVFHSKNKAIFSILAGFCFGLSIQTKSLYLLGVVVPIIWIIYSSIKEKQFKYCLLFIVSFLLPTIIFELYRLVVLCSQFGFAAYWQNNIDIKRTLESGGSGTVILRTGINPRFVYNKLAVWKHIGVDPFIFVWPLILTSPLYRKKHSLIFWNIFFSTLLFFIWFSLFSSTGWFRHILPAVFMGMMLIAYSLTNIFYLSIKTKKWITLFVFCLFLSHAAVAMFSSSFSVPQFTISKDKLFHLMKIPYPNKMQGALSHSIFSRKNQDEVSNFINNNINRSTRICFYEWALVAELPVLVDRVFFPFPRCSKNDILIVGPYQKGFYTLKNTNLPYIEKYICKKNMFSNDMYTLCSINTY